MAQLLKDSEEKINRFLDEAQISLDNECGFPAMLMIFSVMLAVSEAIHPKRKMSDKDLISLFVSKMKYKNWFIHTTRPTFTDDELTEILSDSRDGLSHQISLPFGVILVKDINVIARFTIKGYNCIIAVNELIYSVRKTIKDIINDSNYAGCTIDGKFTGRYFPRGVAGQVYILDLDGTITSGSSS